MPSPEVHQKAKEKFESTQHQIANCSSSLAFLPEDDFVELLWENGDIVIKGQSSRTKNCSLSSCFPFDSPKAHETDEGDAVIPKNERYDNLTSVMNDFSLPAPSGQVGAVQDDEMVPWPNYSVHDPLQSDYFTELFPELTGTNLNSPSRHSNAVLTDSGNSQVGIDPNVTSAHSCGSQEHTNSSEVVGGSESTRIRSNQLCSAKQSRHLESDLRPRDSEQLTKVNSNNQHPALRNLTESPILSTGVTNAASVTPPEPIKKRGLMNFSHFLRPAALVKANLQGISTASASFSSADRLKMNEEVSASGSNLVEPSLISKNSSKSCVGVQHLPISISDKVDSKSYHRPPQELISVEKSEATCQEGASRTNNDTSSRVDAPCQSLSFAASVVAQRSDSERASEPVVASSSVCSGNSAGGLPNEPKHEVKRKAAESEEIEYQSEDAEDESTDVKKPTKSTKRSRTAEVHNLSERRRRDRINEKMRALQELIPNCNKVDKASMLDEAIEYIKTLQLQMQIMSMGSRLCMPPVMLPAGIQHMGTPPMPHFSPLGVGMGMGMSAAFGMGIPEVNHMIRVPSIHGAQFPCPSLPGASSLHGMQVSTPHMFAVPGHHLPFTHPHPPFVPLSGGFCSKESSVLNVSATATPASNRDSSLPSCSKSQTDNVNLRAMPNTSTDCSQIQPSTEETKESSEPADLVQTKNPSPVSGSRVVNSTSENGIAPMGTTRND